MGDYETQIQQKTRESWKWSKYALASSDVCKYEAVKWYSVAKSGYC